MLLFSVVNLKVGYPFSLIKNWLVANYPKLEQNIHADILIMGGGISGALTAWHLIKRNIQCVVVDARTIGLGSTCASTCSGFWPRERLLWNTADPYLYMRTTADNRVMIGGRDEDFYSPARRDKLIGLKTKQLTRDCRKLFPDMDFIPEFSWAGVFGSTEDGLPYIGPYKNLSNSYFALGFGGNGITFSLIAAEMIADLVEGKRNNDFSIVAFDRT